MRFTDKFKMVVWNIGFIEEDIKNVINNKNNKIVWMQHKYNDRFFADPFVLSNYGDIIVLLAEEYLLSERKGKIVKLTVDKLSKKLILKEPFIEEEWHLSYPFIYNNLIYPEQNDGNRWCSYDYNGAMNNKLTNIGFIDATIFNDGKNEWMFTTRIVNSTEDPNKRLLRYKMKNGFPIIDSELTIKNDYEASRPAGNFFKIDNEWYRVAQNSNQDVYGESVSICKVICCDDSTYKEIFIKKIDSHSEKRFNKGLHTLNVEPDFVVVDGFEMQNHLFKKIIYKLRSYFKYE